MKKESIKQLGFRLILMTPMFCLLVMLSDLACGVYTLRNVDFKKLKTAYRSQILRPRIRPLMMPRSLDSLSKNDCPIYTFGASSLIVTDGKNFSQYLEQKLRKPFPCTKVINFGFSGIRSVNVLQRTTLALQQKVSKPRLLVYYFGHNDYNSPYTSVVGPAFQSFPLTMRLMYSLSRQTFRFQKQKDVLKNSVDSMFDWYKVYNRGALVKGTQMLGLLRFSPEQEAFFRELDRTILFVYRTNVHGIIRQGRALGIPILFVTPVGNLYAEPFGPLAKTFRMFKKGKAEKDYIQAIRLLTKARDNERFTGDVRAKTPLYQFLRELKVPGVYTLDLKTKLMSQQFSFSEKHFLDYFHFNDKGHQIVAEHIAQTILSSPIKQRLSRIPSP